MKQVKPITIELMKFPEDKQEIASWETEFGGKPEFDSIHKFILEDQTYYGLDEVIETNYEIYPIGKNEQVLSLVAKEEERIIAWILLDVFDLQEERPQLFIPYICLHPLYQNKGYGSEILKELLLNPEKYFGAVPSYIFAKIDKNNIASQNLFKKFGFELTPITYTSFVSAHTETPRLITEKESSNLGE